jgi:hypothetical protein
VVPGLRERVVSAARPGVEGARLTALPTQFDRRAHAPTVATPSCCCCCCCCIATLVSAPVLTSVKLADEAARAGRPSGPAVALAVVAIPAGLVVGIGLAVVAQQGWLLVLGPALILTLFTAAFRKVGRGSGDAFGQALLVSMLVGVAFVAEFVVGILLIFTFFPLYLVAAAGLIALAIVHANKRSKARALWGPWGAALPPPPSGELPPYFH